MPLRIIYVLKHLRFQPHNSALLKTKALFPRKMIVTAGRCCLPGMDREFSFPQYLLSLTKDGLSLPEGKAPSRGTPFTYNYMELPEGTIQDTLLAS